jgi:hypothetical protein
MIAQPRQEWKESEVWHAPYRQVLDESCGERTVTAAHAVFGCEAGALCISDEWLGSSDLDSP